MLFFHSQVDSYDVNLTRRIRRSTLVWSTHAELKSEMLHMNVWDIPVKWKKAGYQALLKKLRNF
jgi:uncharacterized membrane protein